MQIWLWYVWWKGFGPSWATLYTVHKVSCLYSTVHPITILTKTAPSCWSSCCKMMFIPETKTFQARQLCLLCVCKNDGNAVAHSILLVSKIVRKQGPLKINKRICTISSSGIFSLWYMAQHIWLLHMFEPEDAHGQLFWTRSTWITLSTRCTDGYLSIPGLAFPVAIYAY